MRRKGLTLAEMLVSLAIISFVCLALYSLLRAGIFTRKKIIGFSAQVGSFYAELENISRDIRNCFAFRKQDSGFSGIEKSLIFFTINFDYKLDTPVARRIRYAFSEGKLMKEEYSLLDEEKIKEYVFTEDILDINFYYLDANNQWIRKWPPEVDGAGRERGYFKEEPSPDIEPQQPEDLDSNAQAGSSESSVNKNEVFPQVKLNKRDTTLNKYILLHRG